ncbi:MAG TPA: hybrid sensor histidine kinase/response regulator [Verrucomicrobiae bacterium]|nr:hybrid sensor histidine kinase/response regulator [Verrucomicrobiae bacterium]
MKKILVIDDEEWLREMIQLALKQRGYDVVEAANGAEGIEKARKELPDLILCDINMEKVDGYLTLSSLRSESPTAAIPFILMTGLANNDGMRHGMELGADDYLPKPFTTEALYAAVEARLKKAQTLRDEAERKLASLRDNISLMMPHELRTPLNGIISNAELLATSAATLKPTEITEMGQEIFKSSQRLQRLIENFLIYAQLELIATDTKSVNAMRTGQTDHPGSLVKILATAQAEQTGRSNDLIIETTGVYLPMLEEYFSRVVNELVHNAFKFSESGSPVHVTLTETPVNVIFSVSDRGCGFTTEQIKRVGAYVQFERKLQDQQGLGLGLTIAKRLVELHGGTLTIEGEKGSGTTVTVQLPKVRTEKTPANWQ